MRWYSVAGDAVQVGSATVTPYARVFSVGAKTGGFAWQFPIGVRVDRSGGSEWLPILDITRLVQVGMYVLAAFLFVRSWRAS